MNRLIKEEIGNILVVGVEGDPEFVNQWITGFHNYSICDCPNRLCETFCYFITTKKKFFDGMTNYFQAMRFLAGECAAGFHRILAMKETKSLFASIENEYFYLRLLVAIGRYGETR